ncbi:hypothetical protein QN277_003787 [Acacia crassicarpa]|uniref:NADP-dependent oxidoreductase domain-containing protein n=1 Tax=Acacia crassicarpa TaxID=499986 RepID=A0AAE1IZ49_9FABA|nr:hypothetical protein QN277_003787 [Acacia crassicarpa]
MSATNNVPCLVLTDNHSLPVIGLGTAAVPLEKTVIIEAIKLGYRHFDTASFYGSEESLGNGIAEALKLGLIKSRDELFITSKLWCSDNHPDHVISSLQRSLRSLNLEYLDLYLIHWPVSAKPGKLVYPIDEIDLVPFDLEGVWKEIEKCQKLGLTRSVGVSNFSTKKLEKLLACATIPPTVNQVEMNPCWQQKNLREYCKVKGITITAYSILGSKGTRWGSNEVMDNELLNEIAQAHGKSIAQVCIRWVYEQGVSCIVKSYNKERMKQNLEIFDWSLTVEDYEKISQAKQHRTVRGPTASMLEDLFDEEN